MLETLHIQGVKTLVITILRNNVYRNTMESRGYIRRLIAVGVARKFITELADLPVNQGLQREHCPPGEHWPNHLSPGPHDGGVEQCEDRLGRAEGMVEVWVFGKFTGGAVDCGVGFWGGEMELFLANLCLA